MRSKERQALMGLRELGSHWSAEVRDARGTRGRRHGHEGLLNLLVAALACGRTTLRAMESFCEDVGGRARKALRLPRSVSDSTLYRLLSVQSAAGLRETLTATVNAFWARGSLRNDLFDLGVVSIDGKGAWSSSDTALETARATSSGFTGTPFWALGSLRAVLTSSRARPCVDQELLAAKTGEANAFRVLFPRVCAAHGDKFQVVTGDAGLAARANAAQVREHGKWYCLALKGNQPALLRLAKRLFSDALRMEVSASTTERVGGETLIRELRVVDLPPGTTKFPGATQLWCEWKRHHQDNGSRALEVRFFVVSIPLAEFTNDERLALVRLHWGIENGHNWAMDTALLEDDAKPCQASPQAIEVLLWLRLLGFLLIAVFRTNAPVKDCRPMPWARAMEKLRDLFVGIARREELAAFLG